MDRAFVQTTSDIADMVDDRRMPTPKRYTHHRKLFLEALADKGVVSYAAEQAKVNRTTVYDWKRNDPEFAAAMDVAMQTKQSTQLEVEARRRATEGIPQGVYHNGENW